VLTEVPPTSRYARIFSSRANCSRLIFTSKVWRNFVQTAGADMRNFRSPYRFGLVMRPIRSPWSAERSLARAPRDATGRQTSRKWAGRATDTAERCHSDFVLDALSNGQPVQRVAKCRRDMLAQLDTMRRLEYMSAYV